MDTLPRTLKRKRVLALFAIAFLPAVVLSRPLEGRLSKGTAQYVQRRSRRAQENIFERAQELLESQEQMAPSVNVIEPPAASSADSPAPTPIVLPPAISRIFGPSAIDTMAPTPTIFTRGSIVQSIEKISTTSESLAGKGSSKKKKSKKGCKTKGPKLGKGTKAPSPPTPSKVPTIGKGTKAPSSGKGSSKACAEEVMADERSPSPAGVSFEDKCDAVRFGAGATDGPALEFRVDFVFIFSDDPAATMQRIEDFLQTTAAPKLTGCDYRRRRLIEGEITNVIFTVEEDTLTSPCTSGIPDTTCHHVDIYVTVYFASGTSYSMTVEEATDFITQYCESFTSIQGVEDTFDPCMTMDVIPVPPGSSGAPPGGTGSGSDGGDGSGNGDGGTGDGGTGDGGTGDGGSGTDEDGGVSGVVDEVQMQRKISAGAVVGVALAALLLLLVMLFAIRRKQQETYVTRHHSLDDYDDSTYLKDDYDGRTHTKSDGFSGGSSSSGSPGRFGASPRKTHVVGEADSIMSEWTGFTPDRGARTSALGSSPPVIRTFEEFDPLQTYPGQDVHHCSSATCEVCELNRQAGLQFIPTGMPSHSHESFTGSSSSRDYVASDTVKL